MDNMKFLQKLLHQIILRIHFFWTSQICRDFLLSKLSKYMYISFMVLLLEIWPAEARTELPLC